MKLYVGNLPRQITEDQLREMFAEAGEVVSVKIIMDHATGLPRGFGFVEMESRAAGEKAISLLNARTVEGRALTVNEARPQAPRGGGRGGPGRGGGRGRW